MKWNKNIILKQRKITFQVTFSLLWLSWLLKLPNK